ncbi:FixG Ig-like domain-containing protein [Pseudoalteromonas sp. Hal099]
MGYGVLTGVLIISMVAWVLQRTPIEASVLRDRNALYRVNYEGLVENHTHSLLSIKPSSHCTTA